MNIKIIRADAAGESVRPEVSAIFTAGFYQWLKFFSKDREKLAAALAHMFKLECFYLAEIDGEIAAMAACTDGKSPPVKLDKREFRKYLGLFRGGVAYGILKKEFEEHPYPFELSGETGSVEFVATAEKFRGRGAAPALIRGIFETTAWREYVLEVADTNTSAIKAYEKIGFREFSRVPSKNPKQSGLNFLVYMKYTKS